ncbi:hypothetical protein Pla108_04040 [Botrimarina colliarenosi]|uniref:PEP-CTERM protein-sorting domain-containing protein n=1 Tax=Botrimarina colliarenosi TaxID=2528001 RepID=A0A5C6AJX2_9BACT|nr:hypothetical protein [Botrimarina colliarenosi]TWT99465.1 hypothetical protein Pla108_04040 [Botrimarina colliarenosi]
MSHPLASGRRWTQFLVVAATAGLLAGQSPSLAVVVIRDGFGDADINNNGVPFENVDTDIGGTPPLGSPNTWVPARLRDANGDGPANAEVTTVLDASDTGIRWLQTRGFTSGTSTTPGTGGPKPKMRIVDDATGAMQETMASGLNIPAINDGYAMSWESSGGGSTASGFFDRRIHLGPQVGDEVKVSFDFRIWRDAPNANNMLVPLLGELRFGLFQDTDNQLGMTNPFAGRQVDENGLPITGLKPAVWGQDEGMFEGSLTGQHGPGDDIGTNGDYGWTAGIEMSDTVNNNGGSSRIREELQADRILQGGDTHTIAAPNNLNPDPFGVPEFDFVTLSNAKVYNISLSLVRATEVNPGDTITATLTVFDAATQQSWSLSGTETLADHTSGGVPIAGTGGVQSDSWDYFALRNATSGASEFDFLLDNFLVEVNGSNAGLPGDYNGDNVVDAADYTVWRDGGSPDSGPAGYTLWANNYGATLPASTSAAIPEPSAISLVVAGLAAAIRSRR